MPDRDQDGQTRKPKPPEGKPRARARIGARVWERGTGAAGPKPRIMRALLIGLSAGGVAISLSLWAAGHGHLALRVLAGDVILATALLLIM